MAIMAITTSNSIRVKAVRVRRDKDMISFLLFQAHSINYAMVERGRYNDSKTVRIILSHFLCRLARGPRVYSRPRQFKTIPVRPVSESGGEDVENIMLYAPAVGALKDVVYCVQVVGGTGEV